MTTPEIKLLVGLTGVAVISAFLSEIRITQRARKLRDWVEVAHPDLWSDLNFVARHWYGGHPGLKLLYKRNQVNHPRFRREYERIRSDERQQLIGLGVGIVCIGLIVVGQQLWGWQW